MHLSTFVASHAAYLVQALDGVLAVLAQSVACELVAAARAVRMRDRQRESDRDQQRSSGLGSALALCATLDSTLVDRDLTADIELAAALLDTLRAF